MFHKCWQIYWRAEGLSLFQGGCYQGVMVLTASTRLITAETRVRSQDSLWGNCGGRSGTGTDWNPSTLVVSSQQNLTNAPQARINQYNVNNTAGASRN